MSVEVRQERKLYRMKSYSGAVIRQTVSYHATLELSSVEHMSKSWRTVL
jgi:hypothetical protein